MLCTRFAFVFLAVLALCVPLIECRYLPTRRDNTKVDEIKNILTELLDKVSGHESQRNFSYEKRFVPSHTRPLFGERYLEDYATAPQ
ncbi:UNVERIFIED_CONTAM: hypothetical protein RMT77_000462 [Armadillidium vulgare]